jgi:hypothetical protein
MKEEDLIKKLERIKLPAIEVPGHRSRLKMALLKADRFKERTKEPDTLTTRQVLNGGFAAMIRSLFSHQPVWKSALTALVLVVIIGLAVALPLTLLGEKPVSAEQITADAILASSQVTTVKMEIAMTGTMEIVGGPQAGTSTIASKASSINDSINKRQLTIMDTTIDSPVIGQQQQTSQMYMVEGWMYIKMVLPGGGGQWSKMKMPEILSANESELAKQAEFLKTAQKVTLLGSEKVDGVDCYILQIDPDMQKLIDWLSSQNSALDLSTLNSQSYKAYTFKQWISQDNFLPMKVTQDMIIEILPGANGSTGNDFEKETCTIHAEGKFYDHNKPVTIELPPEAQNALELPLKQ